MSLLVSNQERVCVELISTLLPGSLWVLTCSTQLAWR